MRNISIITIMLLALTMLVGCGEDSKAAAKEAAKSTGKLVGAVVTDAAKTTMEDIGWPKVVPTILKVDLTHIGLI